MPTKLCSFTGHLLTTAAEHELARINHTEWMPLMTNMLRSIFEGWIACADWMLVGVTGVCGDPSCILPDGESVNLKPTSDGVPATQYFLNRLSANLPLNAIHLNAVVESIEYADKGLVLKAMCNRRVFSGWTFNGADFSACSRRHPD
jgi:hypothetical protein